MIGATFASAAPAHAATFCFGSITTINGTTGNDSLIGTNGDDVIAAGAGNDVIDGRGGNDKICGGSGRDRLVGGPGNDQIHGAADFTPDLSVLDNVEIPLLYRRVGAAERRKAAEAALGAS